jgi:hypothetical protein
MSTKVVLEQLGILHESIQPRRTQLKDTLQPVYEVDQPVGDLFLNEQESVFGLSFRENASTESTDEQGPRVTISPLQFYSNFKPESLTPFDYSITFPMTTSTTPLNYTFYTVPSRKILLVSHLVVSIVYTTAARPQYWQRLDNPDALTVSDFYYNLISSAGTNYTAQRFLSTGVGSGIVNGFNKLNENVLQVGSVNRTLVFTENAKLIIQLNLSPAFAPIITDILPAGGVSPFITFQIQGFLITKNEYEIYQQFSKQPTKLDFAPKQKPDLSVEPQLVDRPMSVRQRQITRRFQKRFK